MTKIKEFFTPKQVSRYFDILSKMDRHCGEQYLGYDKLNPTSKPCQKDVFVKRTVGKLFAGRMFLWIENAPTGWQSNDKEFKIKRKRYISIANVRFALGWNDDVVVTYYEASNPHKINELSVSHNSALRLEGKEISSKEFSKIFKLFYYDEPIKSYKFDAYNVKNLKKKIKVNIDAKNREAAIEELQKNKEIFLIH